MKTSHGTQWGRQKEEGGAKAERERERDSERGRRRSDVSFSSFYSLSSMHATERVCIITSGADVSFHRDELKVKISAFCSHTHTLAPFFFWCGGELAAARTHALGDLATSPRGPWAAKVAMVLLAHKHTHTHAHPLPHSLPLTFPLTHTRAGCDSMSLSEVD